MDRISKTETVVADIIEIIEQWAPPELAESWDNCGLQIGASGWPVQKIWVALDPLLNVVEAASHEAVDLIITHHPLMIKPVSRIDLDTTLGKVIETAIVSRTAIYAAHTNLDSAAEGINDVLAGIIGMKNTEPLVPATLAQPAQEDRLTGCSPGLGRVGSLDHEMDVEELVQKVKDGLNLDTIKVAGDARLPLTKVAVCSGGGSGLLETFLHSDAQAYLCGDLRYHDARAAEDAGKVLIDIGHFKSEHIMVDILAERLQVEMRQRQLPVCVDGCKLEKEPFVVI
jgi:dinuclear metal center YbgI/SA1388 family protein